MKIYIDNPLLINGLIRNNSSLSKPNIPGNIVWLPNMVGDCQEIEQQKKKMILTNSTICPNQADAIDNKKAF
jgi:hypothetical protein